MSHDNTNNCPDCEAAVGELHAPGCVIEPCPYCGHQLITCLCPGNGSGSVPAGDRMPWTGVWPGLAECREFGWFSRPDPVSRGYVPCSADDPGALADLNRLHLEGLWDRENKRFVRRHDYAGLTPEGGKGVDMLKMRLKAELRKLGHPFSLCGDKSVFWLDSRGGVNGLTVEFQTFPSHFPLRDRELFRLVQNDGVAPPARVLAALGVQPGAETYSPPPRLELTVLPQEAPDLAYSLARRPDRKGLPTFNDYWEECRKAGDFSPGFHDRWFRPFDPEMTFNWSRRAWSANLRWVDAMRRWKSLGCFAFLK